MRKWGWYVAILLATLVTRADTEAVNGIKWTYAVSGGKAHVGTGWYTTTAVNSSAVAGDLTIPTTLGGCPVTRIDDYAFYYCDKLTSVTIPSSVTSIGACAFCYCSGLTSVSIPSNVTSIGTSAFYNCGKLASVTVPSSVASIGGSAFYGCGGLTSVTILEGVTSIGTSSFRDCSKLTSVMIPSSVTSIGASAFSGCNSLATVRVAVEDGNRVRTMIANSGFNLTGVEIIEEIRPDGVYTDVVSGIAWTYIVQDGLAGVGGGDSSKRAVSKSESGAISVPNKLGGCPIIGISREAFYNCDRLTGIKIPSSVTSIGAYAFNGCSGMTSMTIPSSVTNIGASAFFCCDKLTSMTIPLGVTSIGDEAFFGCSGLTSVTIPSSVTSIGEGAFCGCSGLTSSVTIPGGVPSIGDYAFRGCCGMTSVTISEGVTSIGACAFDGCSGLTSMTIPSSVTNIGASAFCGCTGLMSMTIPSSVTSIGDGAFGYCAGLTSVTIPSRVTSIGDGAFGYCTGLTSVTIPEGVMSIGSYAFEYCRKLTSVMIPEGVTGIGSSAFYGCSGLTSVMIPSSVTRIGGYAFYGCNSLATVYVAAKDGNRVRTMLANSGFNVTGIEIIEAKSDGIYTDTVLGVAWTYIVSGGKARIGTGVYATAAVNPYTVAGDLTIPTTLGGCPVTRIDDYAFCDCNGLTSVTIPSSVTSIGNYAFLFCSKLTSVTIPLGVTNIGDDAFDGTPWHKNLPEGLTVLGSVVYCYKGDCPAQIDLPPGTTCISGGAFKGCKGLVNIDIPNGLRTIGGLAFAECGSLTSIKIPASVENVGKGAFLDCNSLVKVTLGRLDFDTSEFPKGCEILYDVDYVVTFELGAHGTRIGGGELCQIVKHGTGAVAPEVSAEHGWTLDGWDKGFDKVTSDLVVSARWSRVEWTVNVQNPDGSMTSHAVEHEGKMTFTAPEVTVDMGDKRQIVYLGSSVTAPEVLSQFELAVTNDMLVAWDVRSTNFWLETSSPVEDAYYVTVNEWVAANDTRWVYVRPAAHWHLVRWTGDVEGCTPDGNRLKVVMDRPRTIGAELAQDEFTVTFDLGGKGRRTGGGSLQQSVVYGGRATVPDVVSNYGWVFDGWDRDPTQRITGDVTIHAVWRCIKFTETIGGVTYDYLLQDGVAVLDNNGAAAVSGVAAGGAVVVPESLGGSPLEVIGEGAFRGNKSMASVSLPVAVTSIGSDAFAGCDNLTAVRVADVASWLDVSFANAAANPLNNGAALYVRPTTANWFDAGIGEYEDWPSDGSDKVIESVGTWRATANAVLERESGASRLSSVGRNAVRFEVDSPRKTTDGTVVVEAVMTASATGVLPEIASDVKCGFAMVEEANGLKCVGIAKSSSGTFNDWVLLDGCWLEEDLQIALSVSTKKVSGQTYVKYAVNGIELTHGGETWLPMVAESDSIREVSFIGELFSLSGEVMSGGDESAVVDLIIPEGVERVGDYAFAGCASIVNVVIPEGVTSVAPTAFIGCANLKTITLKRKGMNLSWIPDGCEIMYDIDYLVTFDLGAHGERSGGGALQQLVHHGSAAVAPEVLAETGWEFVGWDCAFDAVTDALTVKAVWAELIQDPVILPGDGSIFYDESCMVTITCATAGAKIYYSTSGTPRTTDAYLYTEPFEIDGTASVKAIAVRDGKKSGYVTATITKSVMGLAEAVDAPGVGFETGGATGWRGLPDADAKVGGFVAKSGTTEPNQTNWMEARVEGAGVLTFWWKVNCEEDDSGDCMWDRLMYFVDDAEKDAERIDGVTSWAQCRVEFKTAGWHKVRWEFYRDGEDDPGLVYANCGWVDGVVWTPSDPIPDLGDSPSADAVAQALADANDPLLKQRVTDGGMYKAYRDWAMRLAACGAADLATIKSSSTSWISFALDSACLLEKMPSDGDLCIKQFSPAGNVGAYDFIVELNGAFIGGNALKDNLKLVFGLEGAGSLSPSAFSAENVDVEFAAPVDGKLNFTVKPAKPADTFFMKMRVNP